MVQQEKVLFALHFESLYLQAFRERLTPHLRERLRGLGVDLDKPLLPAYPLEVGKAALQVAAEELYPALARDEALREMGKTFVAGWQRTLMGMAAAGFMKLLGPRRALSRLDRVFRTGDNFTQTHLEELTPNRVQVTFNEVLGAPDYYTGIMHAGAELTGARNLRVVVKRHDPSGTVMLLEWDP